MRYLKSYKIFESSWNLESWTPEEILRDLSIDMYDVGLYVDFPNDNKFGGDFYLSIEDRDKIFCKNWPLDDMDWLWGKPIINRLLKQLEDFGFVRDKDYKLYGGGIGVNIVFKNKEDIKL